MRLSIVGSGYVGLVTGACFAEMGNRVSCVDIDSKKIEALKQGIIPIYEPGLEEMVRSNLRQGRLTFTTDLAQGMEGVQFVFIAVGTPPDEDGSADLSHVLAVARQIGKLMKKYLVVVNKSTVPVGTSEKVRMVIESELAKRGKMIPFDVVSNPEFLKEGDAINDFMKPDRVVVGCDNPKSAELMRRLYLPFIRNGHPVLVMDIPSAELTKYAANAMLATRISFMNEISRLCRATGADVEKIRLGIGSDRRIGMSFLYAGLGYGGSCFPKDIRALIKMSRDRGLSSHIMEAVEKVNDGQRRLFVNDIVKFFRGDLKGRLLAVWGLAFKPQTDDMREAPSVDIIRALMRKGARFRVHDPAAIEAACRVLGERSLEYISDPYQTLKGCDALLLLTEWHQFREPDFKRMRKLLRKPVIFDGRNQYDPQEMRRLRFTYYCIGRPGC